ncbi:hypothetical protein BS50DRAFT_363178 [Corynespora cassiicola Philippines]|uniref:Uncharacterized protein n=1 Tax=Corynespora cassiicola Philippines TaxID=1448308 RepID=A0A2T2NSI4_CORCC|nr:hypothetical protein BS50DRAFT_363178 [Corynespora cassiicola Philippines]
MQNHRCIKIVIVIATLNSVRQFIFITAILRLMIQFAVSRSQVHSAKEKLINTAWGAARTGISRVVRGRAPDRPIWATLSCGSYGERVDPSSAAAYAQCTSLVILL